jgi:hypothetical protein
MKRLDNILNEITNTKTKKLAQQLDSRLVVSVSDTIDEFLKKEVDPINLKVAPDEEPIDRNVILLYAAKGMLNFFTGMKKASEQRLKRKK